MQRGCVFSRQNLSSPAVVQVTETNNAAKFCIFQPKYEGIFPPNYDVVFPPKYEVFPAKI
jgi:hypothetical protein